MPGVGGGVIAFWDLDFAVTKGFMNMRSTLIRDPQVGPRRNS